MNQFKQPGAYLGKLKLSSLLRCDSADGYLWIFNATHHYGNCLLSDW